MTTLFDNNGAEFSPCRKYRYALWRIWDQSRPMIMFIGLNPSTANEQQNDATIRRVISFAKLWGYGGVYMMNCFPYISTNPDDLNDFGNTATNDHWLTVISGRCKDIVFAWGNFQVAKQRGQELSLIFPEASCLVINKDGSPRHPLYVPLKTNLIKFKQ